MSVKYSENVTKKVVESIVDRLGTDIISIYGMGSIGYGGFVPNWSDYDIDVIIKESNSENFIKIMDDIEESLEKNGYVDIDVKCYKLSQLNGEAESIYTYGLTNRLIMISNSAKLLYGEDITEKLTIANKKKIKKKKKTI
ncbi:nucleotidyltransferase domain-containing protein [Staphylococcus saprophyticus]